LSVDSTLVALNNRVLIKNQVDGAQNGVYVVTQTGSGSTPFILTRATDFDTPGSGLNQIDAGDFFLITAGSTNANTSWVQQTPLPIVVGTTPIIFSQFGAGGVTYTAGTGLTLTGNVFSITNTAVTATSYGSASSVGTFTVNAQGQLTAAASTPIAIAGNQITSGTVDSARISGSYTGITGVGTLTSGTWNATAIGAANGGTGLTSYAVGDITYASDVTTLSKLALGATGRVLVAGATAPEYVAQSSLSVGSATTATTATNIAGGAANRIAFNSGSGTTAFIDAPTLSNTYLRWNGSVFDWSTAGTGTVTSVAVSGGTTGLTVSGSPVTSSGTMTLGGTLAIANGGTGATTANNALNAFLPSQTGNAGKVLSTDGSNTSWITSGGGGGAETFNPFLLMGG
jgi:hypothetical protein